MAWHPLRLAAKQTQDTCWYLLDIHEDQLTAEGKAILLRVIRRAQMKEMAYAN